MKERKQNEYCLIRYSEEEKEIFIRDLTDKNNDPACFNITKRGLKKAWLEILNTWNEKTTMRDATVILQAHKIKTHHWCLMD